MNEIWAYQSGENYEYDDLLVDNVESCKCSPLSLQLLHFYTKAANSFEIPVSTYETTACRVPENRKLSKG
jgi:hypothetical protein